MFELTNEFLIRLLFFIVTFTISFLAAKRFFKDKTASLIIGLSIALLAFFYANYSNLEITYLSYGWLGAILLGAVPLVIVFLYLYTNDIGKVPRKLIWVVYFIILFMLYKESNFEYIKEISTILLTTLIILLLFDSKIKHLFNTNKNLKRYKRN